MLFQVNNPFDGQKGQNLISIAVMLFIVVAIVFLLAVLVACIYSVSPYDTPEVAKPIQPIVDFIKPLIH